MTKLYLQDNGIYVERMNEDDFVDLSKFGKYTPPIMIDEKIVSFTCSHVIIFSYDCRRIIETIAHSTDLNTDISSTLLAASNLDEAILYVDRKLFKVTSDLCIEKLPFETDSDYSSLVYNEGHYALYEHNNENDYIKIALIGENGLEHEKMVKLESTPVTKAITVDNHSIAIYLENNGTDEDDDIFPFIRMSFSPQKDSADFSWKSRVFTVPEHNFYVV